jgi:hypothetical protein
VIAMHGQIDRVRATRQLDALSVQAAPNMSQEDHTAFTTRLLDRVRGAVVTVAETAERFILNGKILPTGRAIRASFAETFERGRVA